MQLMLGTCCAGTSRNRGRLCTVAPGRLECYYSPSTRCERPSQETACQIQRRVRQPGSQPYGGTVGYLNPTAVYRIASRCVHLRRQTTPPCAMYTATVTPMQQSSCALATASPSMPLCHRVLLQHVLRVIRSQQSHIPSRGCQHVTGTKPGNPYTKTSALQQE